MSSTPELIKKKKQIYIVAHRSRKLTQCRTVVGFGEASKESQIKWLVEEKIL
jgi:hypothetical protein